MLFTSLDQRREAQHKAYAARDDQPIIIHHSPLNAFTDDHPSLTSVTNYWRQRRITSSGTYLN